MLRIGRSRSKGMDSMVLHKRTTEGSQGEELMKVTRCCTCSQSKKCELLFMLLDLGVVITAVGCSLFMLIQSLRF